jgi:hypothetical protein
MPNNAQFYHAAYIVAALVYGGYSLSIWWRRKKVRERWRARR